jgi:hypothetical protein
MLFVAAAGAGAGTMRVDALENVTYTWGGWLLAVHRGDLWVWHHGFAWKIASGSDGWITVYDGDSEIFCDSSARHKTKKVGVATHERFEEARAAALPCQEEFFFTAAGDTLLFGEWTLTAYADAASTAAASAAPAKAVASVTVEAVHSSDPAHRFCMQRDTPELLQYLVNELKSTLTLDLTSRQQQCQPRQRRQLSLLRLLWGRRITTTALNARLALQSC